jgi:hypothetical protein
MAITKQHKVHPQGQKRTRLLVLFCPVTTLGLLLLYYWPYFTYDRWQGLDEYLHAMLKASPLVLHLCS